MVESRVIQPRCENMLLMPASIRGTYGGGCAIQDMQSAPFHPHHEAAIQERSQKEFGVLRWTRPLSAHLQNLQLCSGKVERATGIEPVSEAWEASVLPLH